MQVPAIYKQSMGWQQDNTPIHTARKVAKYFEKLGVTVLVWPEDSPDLNGVENVSSMLKDYLNKHFPHLERTGESQQARQAFRDAVKQYQCLYHKYEKTCGSGRFGQGLVS